MWLIPCLRVGVMARSPPQKTDRSGCGPHRYLFQAKVAQSVVGRDLIVLSPLESLPEWSPTCISKPRGE